MGQRTGTPTAKIKNIQTPGLHMFSYVFLYVDCSLNHSIKFKLVTKLHTTKPLSLCPIWSGLCSRLAVPMLPKIKRPERYQLRSPTSKGVQGVPIWFQDILRHLEHCSMYYAMWFTAPNFTICESYCTMWIFFFIRLGLPHSDFGSWDQWDPKIRLRAFHKAVHMEAKQLWALISVGSWKRHQKSTNRKSQGLNGLNLMIDVFPLYPHSCHVLAWQVIFPCLSQGQPAVHLRCAEDAGAYTSASKGSPSSPGTPGRRSSDQLSKWSRSYTLVMTHIAIENGHL